jgi:hypothetical protein
MTSTMTASFYLKPNLTGALSTTDIFKHAQRLVFGSIKFSNGYEPILISRIYLGKEKKDICICWQHHM